MPPSVRDEFHQPETAARGSFRIERSAHRDLVGSVVGHRDHQGFLAAEDSDIEVPAEASGRVFQGVGS